MEVIVSDVKLFPDGGAGVYIETLPEARAALARGEKWEQDGGGTWKLRVGPHTWYCAVDLDAEPSQ